MASYLDNVAFNAVILPAFKFMRLAPQDFLALISTIERLLNNKSNQMYVYTKMYLVNSWSFYILSNILNLSFRN